jgi:hypothetical protein
LSIAQGPASRREIESSHADFANKRFRHIEYLFKSVE